MEQRTGQYTGLYQDRGQEAEKSTVILHALDSLESQIRTLEELSERVELDAVSNKPSDKISERPKAPLAALLNSLPLTLEEFGKRITTASLRLTENLF